MSCRTNTSQRSHSSLICKRCRTDGARSPDARKVAAKIRELPGKGLHCEDSSTSADKLPCQHGIGTYVGSDIDESLTWLQQEAQSSHRLVVVVSTANVIYEVDNRVTDWTLDLALGEW